MPDYERKCAYCGKDFVAHDKRKIYCSRRCKDVAIKVRKGLVCNPNVEPFKKKCVVCGKEFETFRERDVCCSKECTDTHLGRNNQKHEKTCAICGKTYTTYWKSQMTCGSDECKDRYRKEQRKNLNERLAEKHRIERAWYKASHTVERTCAECGEIFYCLDSEMKVTCSTECSKERARRKNRERDKTRIRKRKRKHKSSYHSRCRKYGVHYDSSVTREAVIKRDNCTCQICGEKCDPTDKTWGSSGPKYPTLDHIVPLAKGGAHVWANVQCACAMCNSIKRDLLEGVCDVGNDRCG